ncbi:hypothetical protein OG417_22695 [Actinoallomurus sp. NBC_01490]|uniref:hypothetical protein n=1 Tax=Actinoallomurus sp. NBC_01490 TaxID=2903557 RepID=UPI002E31095B|nr:hypothetical protein [Actinoallomurus sp. NBC_01490]
MPDAAYVYVPKPSRGNLEIGLERGIWGWKSKTLDRAGSRDAVASLQDGDFLVLGHRGPDPRVPEGGWSDAVLKRVIVAQVTRRLYTSSTEIWPDAVYPERIDMDILGDHVGVPGLSPDALEALRLSANKQGAPVRRPGTEALFALASADPASDGDTAAEAGTAEGETDVMRLVFVRREQQRLRRLKFGGADEIRCAICGRTLPARIVHAAHIMRRAAANHTQRMDPANIMGACTLGCDTLFEFGHIYVDRDGVVRLGPNAPEVIASAAASLAGLRCDAFCRASEVYFEYHRAEIAKAG